MNKIEDQNKLIAEFMGMQHTDIGWYDNEETLQLQNNTFDELKYHTSWDWLMPVVRKCSDIGGMYDYDTPERDKFEDIFYMDNMFSEFLQMDIEAVYIRVVEFIKQYNK